MHKIDKLIRYPIDTQYVFPDKMEIENGVLRTGRVNEAIRYIYLMDSELPSKKKDKSEAILIFPVKSGWQDD